MKKLFEDLLHYQPQGKRGEIVISVFSTVEFTQQALKTVEFVRQVKLLKQTTLSILTATGIIIIITTITIIIKIIGTIIIVSPLNTDCSQVDDRSQCCQHLHISENFDLSDISMNMKHRNIWIYLIYLLKQLNILIQKKCDNDKERGNGDF